MQINDPLRTNYWLQLLHFTSVTESPKCSSAKDQNMCATWNVPKSHSAPLPLSLLWGRSPKAVIFFPVERDHPHSTAYHSSLSCYAGALRVSLDSSDMFIDLFLLAWDLPGGCNVQGGGANDACLVRLSPKRPPETVCLTSRKFSHQRCRFPGLWEKYPHLFLLTLPLTDAW